MVAERGRTSSATIRALEDRKLDYILGEGELDRTVIGEVVANDGGSLTPLIIERMRRETQLYMKEVLVDGGAALPTQFIYHSFDAANRGRIFCSFLALVLQKDLADQCRDAGITVEWVHLLRDIDRLPEVAIEKDGKRITTRSPISGQVGRVFHIASVELPPNTRDHAA